MSIIIIVEGKNDRSKLKNLLTPEVVIYCTYGTPSTDRLEKLRSSASGQEVFIFTDNDSSGRKIRALLCDIFPNAEQIYTRKGYAGVEGTPDEYLLLQLDKAGLSEFLNPV